MHGENLKLIDALIFCCVNNEMPHYHPTVSLIGRTKIIFTICILTLQSRFERDSYHWRRRYLG